MKTNTVLIILLIAVFIVTAGVFVGIGRIDQRSPRATVGQPEQKPMFEPKSLTVGSVVYTITPDSFSDVISDWQIQVTLDTHTGSLDQDLTREITITDSTNKKYNPTLWQGDPPGGHHRKGVLLFPKPTPGISSFTLTVTVGSQDGQQLEWKL